jgi:hypothetical protein
VSLTASAPSAQYHAQDRGRSVLHHAEIVDGHLVVRRLGPGGWREAWPGAAGARGAGMTPAAVVEDVAALLALAGSLAVLWAVLP